ncbi:RpiB/LacA/LacB family sugar-phosphate isomerase [Mycoplasmopsis cynos]|uniref:RpiB/LacA/LacB family sugar-phosphate isomerase n=1 Tax=Mycoplasmopsis cynos TaxID=171284 RepID=UPI002AFE29D6|nr:RpiB/LacA/LacB family sugar-phosphate isomerase [Mycoplasmopsis cynos]WQQ17309.1 RpiB/LacA/LacB family sugar-phosphate isomerase [Mycoplasmopsis cynos]
MQNKIIAFSSDHGGFKLKQKLIDYVKTLGYQVVDLGPETDEIPISYAEQGHKLAHYINDKHPDFGIAMCGTGLGISYALNRHKHIRAARVVSIEDAHFAKLHNDANVLVFGGRQIAFEDAKKIIDEYIHTKYEGGRHQIRIDQLDIEE